jgi:hypothetical protein
MRFACPAFTVKVAARGPGAQTHDGDVIGTFSKSAVRLID